MTWQAPALIGAYRSTEPQTKNTRTQRRQPSHSRNRRAHTTSNCDRGTCLLSRRTHIHMHCCMRCWRCTQCNRKRDRNNTAAWSTWKQEPCIKKPLPSDYTKKAMHKTTSLGCCAALYVVVTFVLAEHSQHKCACIYEGDADVKKRRLVNCSIWRSTNDMPSGSTHRCIPFDWTAHEKHTHTTPPTIAQPQPTSAHNIK